MSEITTEIIVDSNQLVITPDNNVVSFAPEDFQLNIFATGNLSTNIPAAGNDGAIQYKNGQYIDGASTLFYDDTHFIFSMGSTQNISISGGANGEVLFTDGTGNLGWTHTIANAGYADTSNHSYYSDVATNANTAVFASSAAFANNATHATNANIATLANTATVAYGVNGSTSNIRITGGTSGQFLQTNGNGVLTWSNVNIPTNIVNKLIAGPGIAINNGGVGNVTITATGSLAAGSVNKIIAGNGVTITSTGANGQGDVTINASGGSGSSTITIYTRSGAANAAISSGNITLVGRSGNVSIATS